MKLLPLISLHLALIWASPLDEEETTPIKRNIGGRIIGGVPAAAGEFTFAAAITVQTANSKFFCGGSLISNEWVLTAGQCVNGAILFTIQLGSKSLTADDPSRMTVATSDYVLYPDFNSQTLEHDVGLIKFRQPVEYTDYIRPTQHLALAPIQIDTTLMAMGWGQINDEDPELADQLNWVYLTTIANTECQLTYGNQVMENMVCVNGNYDEGACIGDTGSALIQVVSRGQQIHVAISSFISGNGCQTPDPSGYTRTYSYIDWIRNISNVWP